MNRPPIHIWSSTFGYNGFVIPGYGIVINKNEADNQALIDHETTHWNQYQRMGLLSFLGNYSRHAITKGYDANPMEIEARSNETPYCQENYTECIRTGQADTAHNPKFRKISPALLIAAVAIFLLMKSE